MILSIQLPFYSRLATWGRLLAIGLLLSSACGDSGPVDDVSNGQDAAVGDVSSVPGDVNPSDMGFSDVDTDVEIDIVDVEVGEAIPTGPPRVTFTINEIPPSMNGTIPYIRSDLPGEEFDFSLRVNRHDFTIDFIVDPASGPVDWDAVVLTCSEAILSGGDVVYEAEEPLPVELLLSHGARSRRVHFSESLYFEAGDEIRCATKITGSGDEIEGEVIFSAADLPAHLDPFVEPDIWLVVLSRDIFETTLVTEGTTTRLRSEYVAEGSGRNDFDEVFYALGFFTDEAPQTSELLKAWLLDTIRVETYRMFGLSDEGEGTSESVPLRIYFEGEEGAPERGDFNGQNFSMIALGGDYAIFDGPAFGRALLDWNNQAHEDNTVYGLGVFTTSLLRSLVEMPTTGGLFRTFFPVTGDPFGTFPGEEGILTPEFDLRSASNGVRNRYNIIKLAVEKGGMAIAAVLAHEMGHSLGLVAPGPPPLGLFAGIAGLPFTGSDLDDAHIDTAGLNLMQSGSAFNLSQALTATPRFNELNMAYLRRRIVVGEP